MMIQNKVKALRWPTQKNASVINETDDTTIHEPVLIVAGVRASGKSTFIKALTSDNLDLSILSKLPDGVEKWPQFNAKDLMFRNKQGQVQLKIKLHKSFILHYDILRPLTYNMESFQADQLLDYLIKMKDLNVISILPNSKQLIEQFPDRLELRKRNLSIFAHLRLYVQSNIIKKWLIAKKTPSEKLKPLLLYKDNIWLRDYHKSWKTFIEDNIDPSHHIEITPVIGKSPGWEIIDYNLELLGENDLIK